MHKNMIYTLEELFFHTLKKYKKKPFGQFVDGHQRYTYSTLSDKARELSQQFNRHGVGADAKVAILSENMPHWTIAFFFGGGVRQGGCSDFASIVS